MIIVRQHQGLITVTPNRSASWQDNQRILMGIAGFCLLAALPIIFLGAWFVLPFLGLELLAIYSGLYWVSRRLQRRQTLQFQQSGLLVRDESGGQLQEWHLHPHNTRMNILRANHPWDAHRIALCDYTRNCETAAIAIGHFLNRPDSEVLVQALRQQGLAIASDSRTGSIDC